MMGGESVRIALRGLSANRLRSALTMLGILIGVASVILLVAVGNGSSRAVQQRIESLGTNTLTVFRGGFGRGGGGRASLGTQSRAADLTLADAKALQDKTNAPDVLSASPVATTSVTATYAGASYSPQSFVGSDPAYFKARGYTVAKGRLFDQNDYDSRSRVVVLGQTVVTNLFGAADPIGQSINVNGIAFNVIGVTAAKGSNGLQDQDDVALAPLTTVQDHLTGVGSLNQILVEARSRKQTTAAQDEITAVLSSRHRIATGATPDFTVLNQATLLQTSSQTNRVFTVLLGAVAAISLLVGGIGVMNIMLVTVTERTREIGIRKAIGARRADVLGQFLVEAVLLCVMGGLLGVAAGLFGSRFKIVGVHPVVAPYSVVLAFGVSVAVGLFFGIYPANRAASLRPIDALRYE
jgi:putative ABC transport system permease protein